MNNRYIPTFIFPILLSLILAIPAHSQPESPRHIEVNDQQLWLNGSNVAWVDFANDLGPGSARLDEFEIAFSELRANGGNTFRMWLHTTGGRTPEWEGDMVTGPGPDAISNLRDILDVAEENDIVLLLSLWSFDMLRATNRDELLDRNHAILTQQENRDSYIENSLIPMVDSLKGHNAILAWEIFNEAEGMSQEYGWSLTTRHVPMSDIQTFVNQTAGAIKRTDPGVKVTNSIDRLRYMSDVGGNYNYYRDDRLIAAGGDDVGVLDFYTVHYYGGPSPFDYPASHFEVDKPIVLGEFFLKGDREGISRDRVYKKLYDNGYAGALSWQWVDWRQGRDDNEATWPNTLRNTRYMFSNYQDEVKLAFEARPASYFFTAAETEIEAGFSTILTWAVRNADDIILNGEPVKPMVDLEITPVETTDYVLEMTTDEHGIIKDTITINVIPNLEVNRTSEEQKQAGPDQLWADYELDATYSVKRVTLSFSEDQPDSVTIKGSFDGHSWTEWARVAIEPAGETEVIFETPQDARFVRFYAGEVMHIAEAGVFGLLSDNQAPVLNIIRPSDGTEIFPGTRINIEAEVSTFNEVTFFINGEQKRHSILPPHTFNFDFDEPGEYIIQAKIDNANFPDFYSRPVTVTVLSPEGRKRFEAQDATLSNELEVGSNSDASGGKYVIMQGSGSITWDNVEVPADGTYTARFGYYLPYDYKEQYLEVNGVEVGSIAFEEPTETWQYVETEVDLEEGMNSLALLASWGWMWFDYLEIIGEGIGTPTGIDDLSEYDRPFEYKLGANYPNPFNPETTIPYQLGEDSRVKIEVFDLAGRLVFRIDQGRQQAGSHQVRVDGSRLASGLYFYRIQAASFTETRKMILVK